jgi:hypothetical protein
MFGISRPQRLVVAVALATTIVLSLGAAAPRLTGLQKEERLDLDAVAGIRQEGLQRSQVMEIASYLTDVYGPRLTNSPSIRDAAAWTQQSMTRWGLSNVHLERWPFGRGWQNVRFVAAADAPQPFPLIGFPRAWTPGTNGPVTASAVLAVIKDEQDFDTFRGKLRGKFVLQAPAREVKARFDAPGRRFTDADLSTLMAQPARGRGNPPANNADRQAFERKKRQFWIDEGVAAVLDPSGDGGTFFVQDGGSRDPKAPLAAPQVVLAVEHYGRIERMLERQVPVTLTMDIDNRFFDEDLDAFNIIGDLPGRTKPDEIVMIGAHFDSWHAGTGATDNAAGCAVMLEAMRILKASGATLRRTVRIGLWTGEEQGLLGSRAYVKSHLGDVTSRKLLPEHAKFSGYFNLDNGTGLIRGIYLQGNPAVGPIFSQWEEPLNDLGMTMVAPRGTGGTDHVSFDAIGVPAFQFVQDPIEYDSRTHHSNMDVFERLQRDDLMRNAVILATFAYNAANRDELLPRKAPSDATSR